MPKAKRGRKPKTPPPASDPITDIPEPPEDMGAYGKNYWRSLAPQLIELNILTPLHIETFRVLCECWQEYRRLSVWLDADPNRYYFETDKGYQQETPQVRLRDKAFANMNKLWLKFGLTPHALTQLGKHGGVKGGQLPKISEFAKKKYADG